MNQFEPAPARASSTAARPSAPARREEHTFRGNLASTRHGWLRLTPAYSVRLVQQLLATGKLQPPFLDPFCGTGTTLLSCTEHGFDCDTTDINPFLIWLARGKVAVYSPAARAEARAGLARLCRAALRARPASAWTPPIHRIERWWSAGTLGALSRAFAALAALRESSSRPALELLRIAFCRVLIQCSRAHFGHQSMSFAPAVDSSAAAAAAEREEVAQLLAAALESVLLAAAQRLPATRRRVVLADARNLQAKLPAAHYGAVITSPPYANRMSYIRELRPYMYWLGYLADRTRAGVLDWSAIGGTWGSATSNLASWQPEPGLPPLDRDTEARLAAIAERSTLLSTYVRKYCHDMSHHFRSLAHVLRPGGTVQLVVGNSKFYDVLVPVEQVLARQLEQAGFRSVDVTVLRKRSSKKELYEYVIGAQRR